MNEGVFNCVCPSELSDCGLPFSTSHGEGQECCLKCRVPKSQLELIPPCYEHVSEDQEAGRRY